MLCQLSVKVELFDLTVDDEDKRSWCELSA